MDAARTHQKQDFKEKVDPASTLEKRGQSPRFERDLKFFLHKMARYLL